MSELKITSVVPHVEYREDRVERQLGPREWHSEVINKRFEGTITLTFQSSGDLEGWTREQIMESIFEAVTLDAIYL